MDPLVIAPAAACIALVIVWLQLDRKAATCRRNLPVTPEWMDHLSAERYRPMLRLLQEEDLEFLRRQPGATPALVRRFRAQRCRAFRGYLRWLSVDFDRACDALMVVMVNSPYDRADLLSAFIRSRFGFASSMLVVRCQLFLYRRKLAKVDIARLVGQFDGVRAHLQGFTPAIEAGNA